MLRHGPLKLTRLGRYESDVDAAHRCRSLAARTQSTLAHTIVGGTTLDPSKKTIFIMHGILGATDNDA